MLIVVMMDKWSDATVVQCDRHSGYMVNMVVVALCLGLWSVCLCLVKSCKNKYERVESPGQIKITITSMFDIMKRKLSPEKEADTVNDNLKN